MTNSVPPIQVNSANKTKTPPSHMLVQLSGDFVIESTHQSRLVVGHFFFFYPCWVWIDSDEPLRNMRKSQQLCYPFLWFPFQPNSYWFWGSPDAFSVFMHLKRFPDGIICSINIHLGFGYIQRPPNKGVPQKSKAYNFLHWILSDIGKYICLSFRHVSPAHMLQSSVC